jgi:hypothetical protein
MGNLQHINDVLQMLPVVRADSSLADGPSDTLPMDFIEHGGLSGFGKVRNDK